jgi:Spy/CpxP family protein refolding chaperone
MKRVLAIILMMFTMLAVAYGADESSPPKFRARRGKLTSPWDRITGITPEQRDKIIDVHQRSLEEIRQTREREESDIWNLLTEPQKDQYRMIKGKGRADIATRPSLHAITSQPATTQASVEIRN